MEPLSALAIFPFAMTQTTHTARRASTAIAVVLALGSSVAMAQAVPVPAPVAPAPVAPAPVIAPQAAVPAPPAPAAEPRMVSSPVVQQTPTAIVPPDLPAVTTEAAPEPPSQPRAAAPLPAPAPVTAPAPVDAAIPPVEADLAAAPVAPVAAPEPVIAPPAETGERAAAGTQALDSSDATLLAALLAALGFAGLAIWGFIAIGRRNRGRAVAPAVERPIAASQPAPVVADVPLAAPSADVTPLASPRPLPNAAGGGLAHAGAAVALPRAVPQSFEERDALLRRMIAAKPDRANPFVSPKARLKRARLILQSLGRDFGDREPWIDLGQYSSNWPTSRASSAAA